MRGGVSPSDVGCLTATEEKGEVAGDTRTSPAVQRSRRLGGASPCVSLIRAPARTSPPVAASTPDQVDLAQLVKVYAATPGNKAEVRYSPGEVRAIIKTPVFGNPDPDLITTSHTNARP